MVVKHLVQACWHDVLTQSLVCDTSTPLNFSIPPSECDGTVKCFPISSIASLHIDSSVHAAKKSSTWQRNGTLWPLIVVLCVSLVCCVLEV